MKHFHPPDLSNAEVWRCLHDQQPNCMVGAQQGTATEMLMQGLPPQVLHPQPPEMRMQVLQWQGLPNTDT